MKELIHYSFLNNFKQVKKSKYYLDLPPNIKKSLLKHVTQDEKERFEQVFTRYHSNGYSEVIKQETIQLLLSGIELELLTEGSNNIVNKKEEFNYFYMIK